MCKYLNRTLMTCRFNYSQLVDGSLISPHEGPGPRVLPTNREDFPVAPEFLTAMSGQLQGVQQVMEEAGMVEIKSTLPGMWSMVKFVWNCLESLLWRIWISMPLPPKNTFSCVASHGNRFEMSDCIGLSASTNGAKRFCKFWGHLLILQVCTMLQTAERWLQVNVKIAYLQEIPTTFATSGVVLLCFFAGKQCDSLIVQSFASRTRSIPSWVRVYPGRPGQGSKPPKVIGQELGWKPRILGCHVFSAWSALYFCSTRHKVTNKGQTF